MVELVKFLVESLVDKPEEVQISEKQDGDGFLIEVKVAPEDMGKVIGKNGRIARSIRNLVKAGSNNVRKQYFIKIV